MESIQKNLFYSKSEGILFYVAGYTDNSDNVLEIIEMLKKGANVVAELINADIKEVRTFFVNNSRRYKNMRVFYVKTDVIPKDAFTITEENNWTMSKWVHD
jgi:hypothetical protein